MGPVVSKKMPLRDCIYEEEDHQDDIHNNSFKLTDAEPGHVPIEYRDTMLSPIEIRTGMQTLRSSGPGNNTHKTVNKYGQNVNRGG